MDDLSGLEKFPVRDRTLELTDADFVAILMREPFAGITPDVYAKLTDWQILHCICAARDDDHSLIPIKRRIADLPLLVRLRGRVERDPPSIGELKIPPEAFALAAAHPNMGGGFIAMYWQRLLRHNFTPEQVLERWKAYAAKGFN